MVQHRLSMLFSSPLSSFSSSIFAAATLKWMKRREFLRSTCGTAPGRVVSERCILDSRGRIFDDGCGPRPRPHWPRPARTDHQTTRRHGPLHAARRPFARNRRAPGRVSGADDSGRLEPDHVLDPVVRRRRGGARRGRHLGRGGAPPPPAPRRRSAGHRPLHAARLLAAARRDRPVHTPPVAPRLRPLPALGVRERGARPGAASGRDVAGRGARRCAS